MATKPVSANFKDVDKETVLRARSLVQGGSKDPLTPPDDARASKSDKCEYIRWTERVTVTAAYRTTTNKGLMDVTLALKIRQSEKNEGRSFFAHFYLNNADDISEGHTTMNERSTGSIESLLSSAGLMPTTGTLKASFLAKMFPEKGNPGVAASPIVGKSVIANVVQQVEEARDFKTGKKKPANKDGSPAMSRRDSAETFLPDVATPDEA